MAGVFQPGVFQPGVFQLADGEPVAPTITSNGDLSAAYAVHHRQLQRKLPRNVQRHLLQQIQAQLRADAETRRLIGRVQVQLVQPQRRAVDSGAGLQRRGVNAAVR